MYFWCHRFDRKHNENIFKDSLLMTDLVDDIMYLLSPQEAPRKPPGSPREATKNFRAEILTIFSLLFWPKLWHQKDISKLTDLYFQPISYSQSRSAHTINQCKSRISRIFLSSFSFVYFLSFFFKFKVFN